MWDSIIGWSSIIVGLFLAILAIAFLFEPDPCTKSTKASHELEPLPKDKLYDDEV